MSTPCRPLPLTGPRPSQIAALPNRKGAGEEAFRQPVSAGSAPPKQSRKSGSVPAQIDARGAASETRGASICAHPLPRQNYPLRRPAADRDRILSSFASLLQPTRHPHTSQELWGSIHIQIRITVFTDNCINSRLISANAVFMQLDRLYVALTYLLSIW